jgi:phage shock protein PspC (stress-responsive transcriptional regulator)
MADRLYRSRDDRMLAGVAAGVADALDLDPSLVRIVWALLAIFTGGIAFIVYIVMAIVVPERPAWDQPAAGPWAPPPSPPIVPAAPSDAPPPVGAIPPADAAGSAPFAASSPGAAPSPGTAPIAPPQPPPPPSYWATDREARRAARRARRAAGEPGRGGLIFGIILIVIGAAFLVREVVPWFDWRLWWPIGLIALGGLLLALALLPGRNSD